MIDEIMILTHGISPKSHCSVEPVEELACRL